MESEKPSHADVFVGRIGGLVSQAGSIWERAHDHGEFRRFMHAQGWTAIQSIAVIRTLHGGTLRDAIDRYQSYWELNQAESAAP